MYPYIVGLDTITNPQADWGLRYQIKIQIFINPIMVPQGAVT